MPDTQTRVRAYRFGVFEADLRTRRLYKNGLRVRIQEQPFQLLVSLLELPGEVVSREELRKRIWGDTFGDFEHSLNVAVSKLRDVLGDSADNPRFVETLHGLGYRFIGPVERIGESDRSPAPGPRRRLLWLAAAAAIMLAVGVWLWISRRAPATPGTPLTAVPLTAYPGRELAPSFSPDGTRLAFTWCREDGHCATYIKQIGTEQPQGLTASPSDSPAWSPDGLLVAFRRRLPDGKLGYFLIPAIRGPEQKVAESYPLFSDISSPCLSWFPDSKRLVMVIRASPKEPCALFLYSLETGESRKLTFPPGPHGDGGAAVSPDGRRLVFARGDIPSDLYVLSLSEDLKPRGEPQALGKRGWSPTWTADGRDILYSAGSDTETSTLWRIPASGSGDPQRLAWAGEGAEDATMSRQGHRLAFVRRVFSQDIWRIETPGLREKGSSPVKVISSTRSDFHPQYSPDGKKIAFGSTRSGSREIWACDSDGSNPVRLTSLGAFLENPRWSPEGKRIAFNSLAGEGNQDIYVIRADGGKPLRLTTDPADDKVPSWSVDGKWIYFYSNRSGQGEIWKMPDGGGEAVQVTRKRAYRPRESPDGRFLYCQRPGAGPASHSLWRLPLEGGKETKVLDSVFRGNWEVVEQGIYFIPGLGPDRGYRIEFYDFTASKIKPVAELDRTPGWVISVSPDGRSILCPQLEESSADLMFVENAL